MSLAEKRDQLIQDLQIFEDPQERLAYVVDLARKRPALPDEFKTDEYKVEGCLSNLWFVPSYEDDQCYFRCDADAVIVKGIAGLICDFYSGQQPQEILQIDPSFLAKAGITQHLSQNRKNGLGRLWKKIFTFAGNHLPDVRKVL